MNGGKSGDASSVNNCLLDSKSHMETNLNSSKNPNNSTKNLDDQICQMRREFHRRLQSLEENKYLKFFIAAYVLLLMIAVPALVIAAVAIKKIDGGAVTHAEFHQQVADDVRHTNASMLFQRVQQLEELERENHRRLGQLERMLNATTSEMSRLAATMERHDGILTKISASQKEIYSGSTSISLNSTTKAALSIVLWLCVNVLSNRTV